MANIPRPRVFVSILVWVVSFCGLLMVWQAPPPLSTSSLLHSSSVGPEDADLELLFRRNNNKQVPRTHVSNLAYLQPKVKEKPASWKEKIDSFGEKTNSSKDNSNLHRAKLESWKGKTDSWNDKIDSWKEKTDFSRSKTDTWKEHSNTWEEKEDSSSSLSKSKSYRKISFQSEEESSTRKSPVNDSSRERVSRDMHLPPSRPITYHRSRIKDATPKGIALGSQTSEDNRREERRLLVHQMKMESRGIVNRVSEEKLQKESHKKTTNDQTEESYYSDEEKSADMNTKYDFSYGPRADHEDDDYYDEEYVDGDENEDYDEKDGVSGEEGYPNDEYGEAEIVDLGGRFNVTPTHASIVIYNRVPKCASSTMQTILRRLSKHLNFEHVSSLIYDHHQLTEGEQEKLVENLTTSLTVAPSHALSYDRHLYYTNFTGLGMNPPIYINIVRDPVERFISSFYYRRSEERLNRIQMHGRPVSPSLSWVNRTVEQCVLLNDPECSFVPGEEKELMLSYFCGHQQFCRIVGNRSAAQMAKHVVAKEYSVVGLVEHMDLSLLLLETLVPRFMEGATEIYGNIRQKEHMVVNINHKKPKVSLAIREELFRRMSDDMDFYYFLEQRLFEQRKNFLSKR